MTTLKRGATVQHDRYGRGIVHEDQGRTLLGRPAANVWVLFDRDLPVYGAVPRLVLIAHLTVVGPTGLPVLTAPDVLAFDAPVPLPVPGMPRFGGRIARPGVEIIQGGRP